MRSKPTKAWSSGSQGELALLAKIRARAAKSPAGSLQLGIGDDCAILRLRPNEELAVTTDLSIADRHFRLDWHPPEVIGHRTLARGLSDLAAMGARPVAAFLSLGLPPDLVQSAGARRAPWVEGFLDGFFALASAHKVPLAGGDLAESPIAVADIILTGAVKSGKALLRSGARPGDLIYVTGTLGGSASGLVLLAKLAEAFERSPTARSQAPRLPARFRAALAPHLYPAPRVAQGLWLASHSLASGALATAAIDISDGLSTDLAHLCTESRVSAEIEATAIPIHQGATPAQALNGGEDYELLFTAPPAVHIPRSIAGIPVTRIGRILRPRKGKPPVTLLTAQGPQPLVPRGWEHFS